MQRFTNDDSLPEGFGRGFDERTVEYPWLLSRLHTGNELCLDAGSVLNFPELLVHPAVSPHRLHIVTLAPEPHCYWHTGASYFFHDIADLPIKDATYGAIVCLSTLEHVGCDNSQYGAQGLAGSGGASAAARELRRVVRSGGKVWFSVPFGGEADLGWLRVIDRDGLAAILDAFRPSEISIRYYRYFGHWRRVDERDCLDAGFGSRGCVAAEAVACVELAI